MAIDIKTENIEIIGAEEAIRLFDRLLTSDTQMDAVVKKLIRKELREAKTRVSRDLSGDYVINDPRNAAKAVKYSVYKKLFGGNISILAKRRASSTRATLNRERTLDPRKPGGNRRRRSARTEQLESYYGSDRGFVLRFLNAGTKARKIAFKENGKRKRDKWSEHPNTGNRGVITGNNMFMNTAPKQMSAAIESIVQEIENYIGKVENG